MDRSTPGCPSSHNGQASLGQSTLVCSTSASHGTGTTLRRDQGQNSQGLKIDRKAQPTEGTPALSSALGTRVGAIWLRNAPPQPKL